MLPIIMTNLHFRETPLSLTKIQVYFAFVGWGHLWLLRCINRVAPLSLTLLD